MKRLGSLLRMLLPVLLLAAVPGVAKAEAVTYPAEQKQFTMRVEDMTEQPVTGVASAGFRITDGNKVDVTAEFTITEADDGGYVFAVKQPSEGTDEARFPQQVFYNVTVDPVKGKVTEYAMKTAGTVLVKEHVPSTPEPVKMELKSPAFQVRVYDEKLQQTGDKMIEIVRLEKDAKGNYKKDADGNYVASSRTEDLLWQGYSSTAEATGLPKSFLRKAGTGYEANGIPVEHKELFAVLVYPGADHWAKPTVRIVDFWTANGGIDVSGKLSTVVGDLKVKATAKVVNLVGAAQTKVPVANAELELQKDSAGVVGRTSYTAVGDRVKTNAQGEAALGELAIDEVLDMEPTTDGKGMVLTVPYRVVTQSLPSGMVKPDPTQITVDTRTLNATQAVEIAVRGDTVARISGNNRYQTAVKNAEEAFPEGVQAKDGYYDVLVAYSHNYPDALAGAPLAALYDGPILLTAKDRLSLETKNFIQNLILRKDVARDKIRVTILGGENAVSKTVAEQIRFLGVRVERIWGTSRTDTAIEVSKKVRELQGKLLPREFYHGMKNTETVILASANNYPDVLSMSPMAAQTHTPILLTMTSTLTPETKKVLEDWKIHTVLIAGGPKAVSEDVAKELEEMGITAVRVAGETRYETSLEIAKELYASASSVYVARGDDYSDALTGALAAAKAKAPILLSKPGAANTALLNYVKLSDIDGVSVIGGPKAVSETVLQNLRAVLGEK